MKAAQSAASNEEKRLVVDRFEGDFAVLEDASCHTVDVPRSALPAGVKAGDVLLQLADGSVQIDHETTKARKAAARSRLDALLKRTKE